VSVIRVISNVFNDIMSTVPL